VTAPGKPEVRLDAWAVEWRKPPGGSAWIAPELGSPVLTGTTPDGRWCTTSTIVGAVGRRVETRNTVYVLGRIAPRYRAWLREHRPGWDWRRPVVVREGRVEEPA